MVNACPSVTAWRVARHRARHQLLERGAVFTDPLAIRIMGAEGETLATAGDGPGEKGLRLFMAIRSRIAEDRLAHAVRRGVRQAVVLGGGVDTFGLRNPYERHGLGVFEVDRPVMQDWKRRHLARMGLLVPRSLTYVPVDFAQDSLRAGLVNAGFDPGQPAFFSWLGVVPYLTRADIGQTLRFVSGIPDAEIVFDYGEPVENYHGDHRKRMEARGRFVASVGEPWLSRFSPVAMHAMLRDAGFNAITDYDRAGLSAYFGWPVSRSGPEAGPHVMVARPA
ncbi:Putative S-adenosyl-L-methionine-dependent methyltransferase yktD [Gluconacetobacter sp. SXCC-1]|uniref:class I SAM-dependent methyltransferase n=1 Tax=Komagataeibacter rhaeticus TaxID=215221 RepID=UPI000208023D|nr:SAM-dependent methyltransferase [Komagataeibacter rhaeticus]ATU72388.1 SAM-dependent methyltransferase [Komagataeibacter xylinus]EGG75024.1 Putative S-adenosyl-L-methionine-dependent methyltransferase yktD [Gluconacetobacter sp. SXCC-1]WPP22126.1 SAM-dependent methyltransferase [Komagataeibacter rhaeticus]